MTIHYDKVHSSTVPQRFKTGLLADLHFIENEKHPGVLLQVLLFGSLARSDINYKSDIDLCLVFEDGTDMHSYEMRVFRGMLRGESLGLETDVVTCTQSQLESNSCLLYREINRDRITLAD